MALVRRLGADMDRYQRCGGRDDVDDALQGVREQCDAAGQPVGEVLQPQDQEADHDAAQRESEGSVQLAVESGKTKRYANRRSAMIADARGEPWSKNDRAPQRR
jgi:hypothetical protein